MALVARNLVFDYPGGLRAVAGVDLELRGGELTVVIGPNGAGKSTLLRLLAGLLEPSTGGVAIAGGAVRKLRPRERARRIAVVPQSLPYLPEVTVGSFVLGGRYGHLGPWGRHAEADELVVERALAAADVHGLGERLLEQLSGGQRQRVLIARALAQEADVMLVDEPTSSLDPEHQLAIFGLLARLAAEGHAVLVVTHELNLASQFASRIALLEAGRFVASGSPQEVLREDVLGPVYGGNLRYGRWRRRDGAERPFVVPWLEAEQE